MPAPVFVTSNAYKIEEIEPIFLSAGLAIRPYDRKIEELQTLNSKDIITDKARKAFAAVRQPVIVDHSGLSLDALNGFPGGLTQIFWDILQDRICDLVAALGNDGAAAIISLAYCDGRTVEIFEREKRGTIAPAARAGRDFQWDRIFIPEGDTRTYSEFSVAEKNTVSQRAEAARDLVAMLKARL